MFSHLLFILFLFFFAAWGPGTAPVEAITYGEAVTGEVTDAQFEVFYTFEAQAEDTIVAAIDGDDEAEMILFDPALKLLDPNGEVLADTTTSFDLFEQVIVVQLRQAGIYTLVATRLDGESGVSFGGYELTLDLAQTLDVGAQVESKITDLEDDRYYVLEAIEPFTLQITQATNGNFPYYAVNTVSEGGILQVVGQVFGAQISEVTLTGFEAEQMYIVVVGADEFERPLEAVTATYALTLQPQPQEE
jgi:hypothetical protein